jgi:hypothetical protein
MTDINFRRKKPPKDTVVPDVVASHLKCQHLPTLVFLDPQDTSRSMHLMGVDDYHGIIP